jgi:hypothetical protein
MICRELSIGECQGCTEAYYIDCNCHIEFGY